MNFKIKFGPIFFGNNLVFKGVVSNFLMVVKVVILCFFFRYGPIILVNLQAV